MGHAIKVILYGSLVCVLWFAVLAVGFLAGVVACFSPTGSGDCQWSDPDMAGFVAVGALLASVATLVTYLFIKSLNSTHSSKLSQPRPPFA